MRDARISQEDAYQVVSELTDRTVEELNGVDIHYGKHPERGVLRVIIPIMGESFLLYPFDVHSI